MSRAIPACRLWRVRYYAADMLLACVDIAAPNRRFARWNARDALMAQGRWLHVWQNATRDSVTIAPASATTGRTTATARA